MRNLGADHVIDYTSQGIAQAGRTFDAGFDLIGGSTLESMFAILKPGARIVSIAGPPEPQTATKDLGGGRRLSALFWIASQRVRSRARRAKVHYRYLFMHPSGGQLSHLGHLTGEGKLKVIVDKIYPFARLPEALAYVESGRAKGKVVVAMR